MRRWILMAAAALVLLLFPVEKSDIGELIPVELLYIHLEEGRVCIEADTGDMGTGEDLEGAIQSMKTGAEGKIFLDTADYVIVTEETARLLPKLPRYLRPAAEVCLGIDADAQAAAYLKAQKPGITLRDLRGGSEALPVLRRTGERYVLESKGNT